MVVSNTPEYAMLLIFKTFKGWRVRQVGGLASNRAFPLKPLQSFIIWLFSILRKELWFLKPDFGKTPTSPQVFYKDWMKPFGKWVTPLPSMPPPIFLDSDSFSYPALSPLTVYLPSKGCYSLRTWRRLRQLSTPNLKYSSQGRTVQVDKPPLVSSITHWQLVFWERKPICFSLATCRNVS